MSKVHIFMIHVTNQSNEIVGSANEVFYQLMNYIVCISLFNAICTTYVSEYHDCRILVAYSLHN